MARNISDADEVFGKLPRIWVLLALACGAPVFFLLAAGGHPDKGIVTSVSIAIVFTMAKMSWPLRRRRWFWPMRPCFCLAHAIAVLVISSPRQKLMMWVLMPAGLADYMVSS